ncbi:hypothetical protein EDB85DRAFT_2146193 [Lactarius pseudohatsudake]|nr:hypothetical protein EDB85DRAFT_2146193 [Lactarius pseudohatsudake]
MSGHALPGPLVTGIPAELVNVQALWYNDSADMDILLVIDSPPDTTELTRPRQYGSRDRKALKIFVAVIFLLDALHTSLCIYSVYWYLVLNFGNVEILDTTVWSMNFQVDVNTLIDYMVHLFYARRVYIVGGSIVIPIIIVIFGTASFGKHSCGLLGGTFTTIVLRIITALGLVYTIRATALKFWSHYTSLIWVTCIGLGSAVVANILIAVSMCWLLYHKRTGFARRVQFSPFTPRIWLSFREQNRFRDLGLDELQCPLGCSDKRSRMRRAYQLAPSTMYSGLFFWPMAKFYANALLAMLNSRDYVRSRPSTDNTPHNVFGLSSIRIERSEGDKSRRSAVSITVPSSATTDFPQGKRDHDVESNMVENSKLEASIPSETHHDGRMSDWSM